MPALDVVLVADVLVALVEGLDACVALHVYGRGGGCRGTRVKLSCLECLCGTCVETCSCA